MRNVFFVAFLFVLVGCVHSKKKPSTTELVTDVVLNTAVFAVAVATNTQLPFFPLTLRSHLSTLSLTVFIRCYSECFVRYSDLQIVLRKASPDETSFASEVNKQWISYVRFDATAGWYKISLQNKFNQQILGTREFDFAGEGFEAQIPLQMNCAPTTAAVTRQPVRPY